MSALTPEINEENQPDGRCLLGNWVEEEALPRKTRGLRMRDSECGTVDAGSESAASYYSIFQRATAILDRSGPKSSINRNGHTGILTVDVSAEVRGVSTCRDAFNTPKSFNVRQKGRRAELLEKDLIKRISEQIHAELNPDPPAPEWSSVSKSDYSVEGFKSVHTPLTKEQNYRTEQAITFWSDNHQTIQGVTAVTIKDGPFKRNAAFSTPISEQLDCLDDHTEPF